VLEILEIHGNPIAVNYKFIIDAKNYWKIFGIPQESSRRSSIIKILKSQNTVQAAVSRNQPQIMAKSLMSILA